MSRTVAALFNSRAEAELARGRLIGEFGARSPRIIGKDTAGAVDGLKISKAAAANYREGLSRGGHLLVTEVPRGTNPERIIAIIQHSIGDDADERQNAPAVEPQQSFHVAAPATAETGSTPADAAEPEPAHELPPDAEPQAAPEESVEESEPAGAPQAREAARSPGGEQDVRIGRRAFTRETTAEEQVALRDELVDVENRTSERRLTDDELESGGLFTERVIEIAAMREEPVVTKVAVVREEIIVRKRVEERTETIRDTVRHTEVEVEDAAAPAFFDDRPSGRRGAH
jgi:hypothetical protein